MTLQDSCNGTFNGTSHCRRGFFKGEYHAVLLILAVLIILHNCVVLHLYRTRRSLHNETNLALVSTACADLLTGLIFIPFHVCAAVLAGRGPGLNPLYFTSNVIGDFVTMAVVLNLLLVTLDRYTALCHPYFYESLVHESLMRRIIACLWLASSIMALIPLSWSYPAIIGERRDLTKYYQAYSITTLILVFFLPSVIMIFGLVSMFRVVKRFANTDRAHTLRTRSITRPQTKAIIVFLAMFLNVFVCWSPLMIIRMIMDVSPGFTPTRELLEFLVLFRCCSSFCDPIICIWCKKDFKRALLSVLCPTKRNNRQELLRPCHSEKERNESTV